MELQLLFAVVFGLWALSMYFPDGIIGGVGVVIGLAVVLRNMDGENITKLSNRNAWILLLTICVYLLGILLLPECSIDRHGTRFCRVTHTDGTFILGIGFLAFISGVLVDAPLFSLAMILLIGWVHYGKYGTSFTESEKRQMSLHGGITNV